MFTSKIILWQALSMMPWSHPIDMRINSVLVSGGKPL